VKKPECSRSFAVAPRVYWIGAGGGRKRQALHVLCAHNLNNTDQHKSIVALKKNLNLHKKANVSVFIFIKTAKLEQRT
jgi:hypothetical protein